jgi:hypothetical protein
MKQAKPKSVPGEVAATDPVPASTLFNGRREIEIEHEGESIESINTLIPEIKKYQPAQKPRNFP